MPLFVTHCHLFVSTHPSRKKKKPQKKISSAFLHLDHSFDSLVFLVVHSTYTDILYTIFNENTIIFLFVFSFFFLEGDDGVVVFAG